MKQIKTYLSSLCHTFFLIVLSITACGSSCLLVFICFYLNHYYVFSLSLLFDGLIFFLSSNNVERLTSCGDVLPGDASGLGPTPHGGGAQWQVFTNEVSVEVRQWRMDGGGDFTPSSLIYWLDMGFPMGITEHLGFQREAAWRYPWSLSIRKAVCWPFALEFIRWKNKIWLFLG